MSASREKKARQETGKELTPKQLKAQQDQQKAKRNTIIYSVVGAVCAVLIAALLIWNSGFFQKRAAALTVGGVDYPAADVQYHYSQIANEWYSYAQYGYINNLDPQVSPQEQKYDENQTWHEMFLDSAVDVAAQYKVLVQAAAKDGVTLSEEGQAAVQAEIEKLTADVLAGGYSEVEEYLSMVYGPFMTVEKLEQLLSETYLATEYAQAYSDALSYTDADLENYYVEHKDEMDLFKYGYVLFDGSPAKKTDADGKTISPTEEEAKAAMAEAKKKADALAKKLEKGADYDEAVAAYAEDSTVTVNKILAHPGNGVSALYGEWVKDAARKEGDVLVVENSAGTGYYLVYFISAGRDPEITGDIRHILVAADVDEGAVVPNEAQYEAAKKKAEDLLAQWKKNGATEEAFAELAKTESSDPGSAQNGGLMTGVSTAGTYVSEFANWVVEPGRKSGDTGIVKNEGSAVKGYHVMYYVAPNEALWKIDTRATMKNEASTNWVMDMLDAANVTERDGLKYVG